MCKNARRLRFRERVTAARETGYRRLSKPLITCFASAPLGITLMVRRVRTRVKNLDILWRRLPFSLSVAAKSRHRERRLLFSSLGCD